MPISVHLNAIVPAVLAVCMALALTGCVHPSAHQASGVSYYNTSADGEEQIQAALIQAKVEKKRVLLDLGANWCTDSQAMYRLFLGNNEIRTELEKHYVLVLVDVNDHVTPPRNLKVIQRFGNPLNHGIPVLLVLDSDGTLLNKDDSDRLRDDAHSRPDEVLAFLSKWAQP